MSLCAFREQQEREKERMREYMKKCRNTMVCADGKADSMPMQLIVYARANAFVRSACVNACCVRSPTVVLVGVFFLLSFLLISLSYYIPIGRSY